MGFFPLSESDDQTTIIDASTPAEQQAAWKWFQEFIAGQLEDEENMADHEVRLTTKRLLIGGIDLDFDVKVDGRVLGTLGISEGGLVWRKKGSSKKGAVEISWSEFAEWAES